VKPIGRTIDRLALHAEVKGEIPPGPPRQALDS
jgi:hypothetical protein